MGGPEGFSGLQGVGQLLWAPVECMGFPSRQKEEGFGVGGGSECGKKSSGVLGRCLLLFASVEGLGKVTGAHSIGVLFPGLCFPVGSGSWRFTAAGHCGFRNTHWVVFPSLASCFLPTLLFYILFTIEHCRSCLQRF